MSILELTYDWNSELELNINGNVVWWDDGFPGGGDYLARIGIDFEAMEDDEFTEFLDNLGVTWDTFMQLVCDNIQKIEIDDKIGLEFLKDRYEGTPDHIIYPDAVDLFVKSTVMRCPHCHLMNDCSSYDGPTFTCLECGEPFEISFI